MLLANASFFYYVKLKTTAAERSRIDARISVLESAVRQLRSGEPLSDDDLARLRRLATPRPLGAVEEQSHRYEPVPWKEIFWRNKEKNAMSMSDEYLDKIAAELENARHEQQR
uniref:Uncharacterized protein n=1 Tax=Mycena chlorophos TaxID=658473 RepID=A0ABQ0LD65_MYCCL|nr:predicted protein [Mycena chlorophos]